MKYEVIVVGGGHAGCEAANAASKLGKKTALITGNINNIGDMPCNPSIGGTAKGIIVREIDALGGLMGKVADRAHFQIKMLNDSKGPAVRSLRAQADKVLYPKLMLEELKNIDNLDIIEALAEDIVVENSKIVAIVLEDGTRIDCDALILTTGTYLKGTILRGDTKVEEGPHGERRSNYLSDALKREGFTIQRLKTGTPPRITKDSINFEGMQEELGSDRYLTFSHDMDPIYDIDNQESCFLIYTNDETKKIIQDNLDKSSMYGGYVEGIGPRYCPSIEDKIVRFSDKDRHQLFLEPESKFTDEWYIQGFSTSMPIDVQDKMVHSLKGLENAVITKYAYAIEYDAIDPLQVKYSLESKVIENLFTAGQINGTSGYEEAAAQGLVAGCNAVNKLNNKEPLVFKRNEAYIGVLIDDLVTKGTQEPYRMLTSRAEFRLILRHDNADLRLRKMGYDQGLVTDEQFNNLENKLKEIDEVNLFLEQKLKITDDVKNIFENNNKTVPNSSMSLAELLKRPEITIEFLSNFYDFNFNKDILDIVNISIKYEGYINKTYKEVEKLIKLEAKKIPSDIDYDKVKNLASEARQKLKLVRPNTIAQATRISGVNPADISILTVYLKREYSNE